MRRSLFSTFLQFAGGGQTITALRSVHLVKDIVDFFHNTSSTKVALRQAVFILPTSMMSSINDGISLLVGLVTQKLCCHL